MHGDAADRGRELDVKSSMIECTCATCGKKSWRFPSWIVSKKTYCSRKCANKGLLGSSTWNKGKTWSPTIRRKISRAVRRSGKSIRHNNPASRTVGPWSNVTCTICGCTFHLPPAQLARTKVHCCSRACKDQAHAKILSGVGNPNWHGGGPYHAGAYGAKFNNVLKNSIRDRENHHCLVCQRAENEFKIALSIHHIDYDKKNNHPWNLVALCQPCHISTSAHRAAWTEFFRIVNDERGFNPTVVKQEAVAAGN